MIGDKEMDALHNAELKEEKVEESEAKREQTEEIMIGDKEMDALHNAELKEAFDAFDKDGSGAISQDELLGVMRAMGQNPTEDEVLNLMMEADLDGNGTIEFQEFSELMKEKYRFEDQESDLKEAFKLFDRDRDGFITLKELKKVSQILGNLMEQEELEEFMREADVDGNGQLDYEEFCKMMLSV